MVKAVVLFTVGFLFLIKGGDWFVDGASGLAHKFRIPEILIGATVVSIGTTLPEVMVSASAAVGGHGEIAYGNAIGSVICNTALIAALTVAIRPAPVDRKTFRIPVFFFFGAAVFYMAVAYWSGFFDRWVGIVLLAIFAVFMGITIWQAKKEPAPAEVQEEVQPIAKSVILLVIGAVLIALGANFLVDNGTIIARGLGVPESVIALTFVALGTSLPELVTAITSLLKGHGALSLGNVIGANLFNLVLVSGLATTLSPFSVPQEKTIAGVNAGLAVDLPVMLCVMLILCVPALIRNKLSRWQGVLLLGIYAAFCVFQFAF